jgi:hypothetical protein
MADSSLLIGGAVFVGGVSLGIGFLFSSLANSKAQRTAYLRGSPKFSSFGAELHQHLKSQPDHESNVLLEGTTQKLDGFHLYSERAGVIGAGRIVTTVEHYKTKDEYNKGRWINMSNTTENLCLSVPFNLKGVDGSVVRVENAHNSDGFRKILSVAYKDNITHEGKTLGDFAVDITINRIPMGKEVTELMLYFGVPFAGYGQAKLLSNSVDTSIVFSPQEVSSNIDSLISSNESVASLFRFFSWTFFAVAGGTVVFVIAPKLLQLIQRESEDERQ